MRLENYGMVVHLSHTDTDGYTPQYLVGPLVQAGSGVYIPYNTDYDNVEIIVERVVKNIKSRPSPDIKVLLLITDLNIGEDTAKLLNQQDDIDVYLIDHHNVNYDIEQYDWYHLDKTKSATLATYEWLKGMYPDNEYLPEIKDFILCVDYADTFKEVDSWLFAFGRYTDRLIKKFNKELPFVIRNRNHIINNVIEVMISELDTNTIQLHNYSIDPAADITDLYDKILFSIDGKINNILSIMLANQNKPLQDAIIDVIVEGIVKLPRQNTIKTSNGTKILITLDLPGITDISKILFKHHSDEFDVIINLSSRGGVGLRVSPTSNYDCSVLAKLLSVDGKGGGHTKASGCYRPLNGKAINGLIPLEDFEEIKSIIEST